MSDIRINPVWRWFDNRDLIGHRREILGFIMLCMQEIAGSISPRGACRWFDYHDWTKTSPRWALDHCRWCGRDRYEIK
jgi:hypothetical protein